MKRVENKWWPVSVAVLVVVSSLLLMVCWSGNTASAVQQGNNLKELKVVVTETPPQPVTIASTLPTEIAAPSMQLAVAKTSAPANMGSLDERRRFALGMIETANDDSEIGRAGEVSRYQIMPSVWKRYSSSMQYRNPMVSTQVAQKHWNWLREFFIKKTRREPTDFDMYVLWNTRIGYYAKCGFEPSRLHPVVRDRAQRFVNLVERSES